MNDWEYQANASLRSLADARERGQLDRAEYRQRRRRVLQAGHNRQVQTQPNALQPTASAPVPVRRTAEGTVWKWVMVGLVFLAVGLLIWMLRG